jgi:hypothetical protein
MEKTYYAGVEYRHYNHLYAVSEKGHVLREGVPFYPKTCKKGGDKRLGRQCALHRAVAMCWLEQPKGAKHVHHKDRNRANNHADNLEWVTPQQHVERHADTVGRHTCPTWLKDKLRHLKTGSTLSEETKQKMSKAQKAIGNKPPSWAGKNHRKSTKALMSQNNGMNRGCRVKGVTYRSFSEAGRALGEKPLSLRRRCLSQNFLDYQLV